MPRIYVLSGPDLGRTFDVAAGATFGRTAECQVILRDASVSRAHARLETTESGWRVVDTGSRNGLFARDERVPSFDLDDGDEFRLGEVVLRFRADAAPAERAPTPVAPIEPASSGPEIRFHARGASRAEPEVESADIELEGDWSQPAAPVAPPARPIERVDAQRAAPEPQRASPTAAPRSLANDERARKLAAAGLAPGREAAGARGVLQYNKVAQQDGVLKQELGQQPAWLRFTIVAVVAVVLAGLAWLGYQAATGAKERLAPDEPAVEESDATAR